MKTVSVAEAKAKLSELLEAASHGEIVEVTRRGKTLAHIGPPVRKAVAIDFDALLAHRRTLTSPVQSTDNELRDWKDEEERLK